MKNVNGLIFILDEPRRKEVITNSIIEYDKFTDTLSVPDWGLKPLSAAIICMNEKTISYMCIAQKGINVATAKTKVHFFKFISLDNLPLVQVENRIKNNLAHHFVRSARGGGKKIPEKTFLGVVNSIISLRPDKAREINSLLQRISESGKLIQGNQASRWIMEREAVGLSLEIFTPGGTLRKDILSSWTPTAFNRENSQSESCFLDGIGLDMQNEDDFILHDKENFPGFTSADRTSSGKRSIFNSGGRRLDIIYANRNKLEHTLGVDLIYYNKRYNSFVMVQYKMMKRKNIGEEYYFRPDEQADIELARMNNHFHRISKSEKEINDTNYRLSYEGFFFKLIASEDLKIGNGSLSPGVYLSRDYINYLFGSEGPKGKLGGRKITFQTAPRHLNNSEFASMVNRGWIGTSGISSIEISDLLKSMGNPSHTQYFAIESTINF
jgi:hypothetical protein